MAKLVGSRPPWITDAALAHLIKAGVAGDPRKLPPHKVGDIVVRALAEQGPAKFAGPYRIERITWDSFYDVRDIPTNAYLFHLPPAWFRLQKNP